MRPAQFGRKPRQLTDAQIRARFAALMLFGLFVASLTGALTVEHAGGAFLLTVLGFGALLVAVFAVGEA